MHRLARMVGPIPDLVILLQPLARYIRHKISAYQRRPLEAPQRRANWRESAGKAGQVAVL